MGLKLKLRSILILMQNKTLNLVSNLIRLSPKHYICIKNQNSYQLKSKKLISETGFLPLDLRLDIDNQGWIQTELSGAWAWAWARLEQARNEPYNSEPEPNPKFYIILNPSSNNHLSGSARLASQLSSPKI